MAAPQTMTDVGTLYSEYQQFLSNYANMLASAQAFVTIGNLLAANPQLSIASAAFKTSASSVLTQVSSFLATAPANFPAA